MTLQKIKPKKNFLGFIFLLHSNVRLLDDEVSDTQTSVEFTALT